MNRYRDDLSFIIFYLFYPFIDHQYRDEEHESESYLTMNSFLPMKCSIEFSVLIFSFKQLICEQTCG